jgi:hypothetical protein
MIQSLSNPQVEKELGARLKQQRLDRNFSQAEIATRS